MCDMNSNEDASMNIEPEGDENLTNIRNCEDSLLNLKAVLSEGELITASQSASPAYDNCETSIQNVEGEGLLGASGSDNYEINVKMEPKGEEDPSTPDFDIISPNCVPQFEMDHVKPEASSSSTSIMTRSKSLGRAKSVADNETSGKVAWTKANISNQEVMSDDELCQCEMCLKTVKEDCDNLPSCEAFGHAYSIRSMNFQSGAIVEKAIRFGITSYICKICSKEFLLRSNLIKHQKSHQRHPLNCKFYPSAVDKDKVTDNEETCFLEIAMPYQCTVCSKSFPSKWDLKKHQWPQPASRAYKCKICSKTFVRKAAWKQHEKSSHPPPHQCKTCAISFASASMLNKHALVHFDPNPYQCDVCPEKFKLDSMRKAHKLKIHGSITPHQCSVCAKSFRQLSQLKAHEVIHSGIRSKPFKCDICSKTYYCKSHLRSHKKIHSSARPYHCAVCPKAFYAKSKLKQHEVVHSDMRPYQCTVCSKVFSSKSSLKYHGKIHSGNRPYQCEICSKPFITPSLLKRHVIMHSDEKPYQCDVCSKSFKLESLLKIHKNAVHGPTKTQCRVCHEFFNDRNQLKLHEEIHDESSLKPFQCDICLKGFSTKAYLRGHKRIHTGKNPHKCPVCSKGFPSQYKLKRHEVVHTGMKLYQCKFCLKAYTLKATLAVHERLHTGDKPFKCNICSKSFVLKGRLKTHHKIHSRHLSQQSSDQCTDPDTIFMQTA